MPAASSGPFAPLWGQDRSEHFLPWYQQDSAHLDRTSAGADIASIMSQKHQKKSERMALSAVRVVVCAFRASPFCQLRLSLAISRH